MAVLFSSVGKRQANKNMEVSEHGSIWNATLNSSDIYLRNIWLGHIVILFFLKKFFIIISIVSAPVTLPSPATVVMYFMIILLNGTKWNL